MSESLPSAESGVPTCRFCGHPIRRGGFSGVTRWEHYPVGPFASRRGWQGERCPGRLTLAEPRDIPPAGIGAIADAYQCGYDDGVEQEQVSLAKLFGAHEDNDHDLLVVVRGYIRGYHLKYADTRILPPGV